MSADDYAAFQRTQHGTIVRMGDVLWKRVRPFFYRPLLVFDELDPRSVQVPGGAILGGYQFAVSASQPSNSFLNFRVFADIRDYSPERLDKNPRRQIKLAAKRLTLRVITEPGEFKVQAYPVYLSFYARTHYPFMVERRKRASFEKWSDDLFRFPGNLVLGAYHGDRLGAVGVTQLINDTVLYSTFFSDDKSLKLHAADLILHAVRTAARAHNVRQIYAGMQADGAGVDRFYLLRGGQVVRKPAWLKLNAVSGFFLRNCLPGTYARLCGHLNGDARPVVLARDAL